MDLWRAVGLFAVGLGGVVVVAWLAGRLERDPARDALRGWAERMGLPLRGDGFENPLEVVGRVNDRWFTASYDANARVLLVGLDCFGEGGTVQDDALVTRWTAPTAEQIGRLSAVLEEMVAAAVAAEAGNAIVPSE